jgi:hypothetical protein
MSSAIASENDARTSEVFEAEDRSGFSFDCSVILLDEVSRPEESHLQPLAHYRDRTASAGRGTRSIAA